MNEKENHLHIGKSYSMKCLLTIIKTGVNQFLVD